MQNLSDTIRQLNVDTDREANRWFREKRRIGLPVVFWRMLQKGMRACFLEGGFRKGFLGLMRAVNESLYELFSYAKCWELKERERGRM